MSQDAPRSITDATSTRSLRTSSITALTSFGLEASSLGEAVITFYVLNFGIPPDQLTFQRSRHRLGSEIAVKAPIRITSTLIDAHPSVGPTPTPSQIPKATASNPTAPCLDEVPRVYRSPTSISSFLNHQFGVFSDSMGPFPFHKAETVSASQRSDLSDFALDEAHWTPLQRSNTNLGHPPIHLAGPLHMHFMYHPSL